MLTEKTRNGRAAFWIRLGTGALLAGASAGWALPAAWAERGCLSAGGEWLLILLAAAAPFLCGPEVWCK